jgi:hypothetical protein
MDKEKVIEGETTEIAGEEEPTEGKCAEPRASATALRGAVESLSKTVTSVMENRNNVVMVRVNDDALRHMDMLVEAEITKSRSESAAFLINEGVKSNSALYKKISSLTDQIVALRSQLREMVDTEAKE